MEIVNKDAGDRFDREMARGYQMKEDHMDTGGAVSGHTCYPIIDQLRGESKKRWQRKFEDVDECNEFIMIHPQLRGVPKGMVRAIMDENDLWIQMDAIEILGTELIRGKNATSLSYLYG
jgi:hypothetical protein